MFKFLKELWLTKFLQTLVLLAAPVRANALPELSKKAMFTQSILIFV